jgi:hypothetical protein
MAPTVSSGDLASNPTAAAIDDATIEGARRVGSRPMVVVDVGTRLGGRAPDGTTLYVSRPVGQVRRQLITNFVDRPPLH